MFKPLTPNQIASINPVDICVSCISVLAGSVEALCSGPDLICPFAPLADVPSIFVRISNGPAHFCYAPKTDRSTDTRH